MIRVLYITRARLSFLRAHARNIIKTAEYLNRESDCAVTVFSSAAELLEAENIFKTKGVTHPFPLDVSPHKRSLLFAVFQLRGTYDILYYRDPKLFFVAAVTRVFLRKRIVFEAHGSHEWRFLKGVWILAFRMAHSTVFITERLRQWYGADEARSVVTHVNALDDEFFSKDRTALRNKTRSLLGIPDSVFLLGYVGSTLWYNVDVLIAMLPLLSENTQLVLVGMKHDEETEIRAYAQTLRVENRLIIEGRVLSRDVFPRLVACDVLLIPPTLTYPGSICSKIYEYLASGVPIVAHPAGANDEVLHDGKNAFLISSNRPQEFAQAVKRLQQDKNLRTIMGQQAVIDAKAYTWKRRAEAIASLFMVSRQDIRPNSFLSRSEPLR